MKLAQISVEFEKRVGDNDYGSERLQLGLIADLDDDDDAAAATDELLKMARERVNADLRQSVTLVVRRKMSAKPRLCDVCKLPLSDDDDYEHPACTEVRRERERAERAEREAKWAQERAEREARAGVVVADIELADDDERESDMNVGARRQDDEDLPS
jgi:hypothetical protein